MKNKILHFVIINICFIAFSCISDKYKETSVVPQKSSYSAASQTIEDIVVDFSNGSNDKYIMQFALSGSQSDTSVAIILSTNNNVAKIKHTTNGSRNLVISYYAKGQLVSKDSVEITTSGSSGGTSGTSYAGNIFYLKENVPYVCKSNGTGVYKLSNYLSLSVACLDNTAKKILYPSGNYSYIFDIASQSNSSLYTATSVNNINVNKNGYICLDYSTNSFVKVYNSDFSSFITTFYPSYTGSYMVDKYLNSYTSSTSNEYACISYTFNSYSYYYYYYLQYTKNNSTSTIATKTYSSSSPNLKKVCISPNSKYLSYVEYDGSYYYLKVYDLNSTSTTTVFTSSYGIDSYSFNTDGSKIVVSAYNYNQSSNDLFVINSTGGTSTNISNSYNIDETSVDWK